MDLSPVTLSVTASVSLYTFECQRFNNDGDSVTDNWGKYDGKNIRLLRFEDDFPQVSHVMKEFQAGLAKVKVPNSHSTYGRVGSTFIAQPSYR